MTNSADGSMIADTLQSAADQTVAAEASGEAGKSETQKTDAAANTAKTAVAEAKPANKEQKPTTVAATETESAQDGSIQVAALAPQTKSTSLFGIFGKKSSESPAAVAPASEATEAAKPEQTKEQAAAAETKPVATETKQAETPKPAESEKPTQVASLFGSAKMPMHMPRHNVLPRLVKAALPASSTMKLRVVQAPLRIRSSLS